MNGVSGNDSIFENHNFLKVFVIYFLKMLSLIVCQNVNMQHLSNFNAGPNWDFSARNSIFHLIS